MPYIWVKRKQTDSTKQTDYKTEENHEEVKQIKENANKESETIENVTQKKTKRKLREGKMPYIRVKRKQTDYKAEENYEQVMETEEKANEQNEILKKTKRFCEEKMSFISMKKKSNVSERIGTPNETVQQSNSSHDRRSELKPIQIIESKSTQESRQETKEKLLPYKPHNLPNLKFKYLPKTKPFSEPRSKRHLESPETKPEKFRKLHETCKMSPTNKSDTTINNTKTDNLNQDSQTAKSHTKASGKKIEIKENSMYTENQNLNIETKKKKSNMHTQKEKPNLNTKRENSKFDSKEENLGMDAKKENLNTKKNYSNLDTKKEISNMDTKEEYSNMDTEEYSNIDSKKENSNLEAEEENSNMDTQKENSNMDITNENSNMHTKKENSNMERKKENSSVQGNENINGTQVTNDNSDKKHDTCIEDYKQKRESTFGDQTDQTADQKTCDLVQSKHKKHDQNSDTNFNETKQNLEPDSTYQNRKKSTRTAQKQGTKSNVNKVPQTKTSLHSSNERKTLNFRDTFITQELNNEPIQGHFNQGHPQFGENSGRQCVANSVCSMLFSKIKNMSTWNSNDLDTVLHTGNELYSYLQRSSTMHAAYLLVSELPNVLESFDTLFTLTLGESITGFVNHNVEENADMPFVLNLDQALQTVFSQHEACFITFGEATFAVVENDGKFYIFDSHSRSIQGLQVPDGRSILLKCTNLLQVYEHCLNLALSMNQTVLTQFEMTGMTIFSDDDRIPVNISETVNETVTTETDMSDTHITEIVEDSEGSSVEIVANDQNVMLFCPVSPDQCRQLCDSLNIDYKCCPYRNRVQFGLEIAEPCKTIPIAGDGNCFFRSISYAISGTEHHHRKIRRAVVKHLQDHAVTFKHLLRPGCESLQQYIKGSRMWYTGIWATEVEIFACARLLSIDICTYSGNRWLRHSRNLMNAHSQNSGTAIYLNHLRQEHYEVVASIKTTRTVINACRDTNYEELKLTNIQRQKRNAKEYITDDNEVVTKKSNLDSKRCSQTDEICPKTTDKYESLKAKTEYMRSKRKRNLNAPEDGEQSSKQRKLMKLRDQYHNNPEIREEKKQRGIQKYMENTVYRKSRRRYSTKKYGKDTEFRESVKKYSSKKYAENVDFRESAKKYSSEKYAENEEFRESAKKYSTEKYAENVEFRESAKKYSTEKYAENVEFKNTVKRYSAEKYAENQQFRESLKRYSSDKYAEDEKHRENKKNQVTERRNKKRKSLEEFTNVKQTFLDQISQGPEFVCSVCHRRHFRNQVIQCRKSIYQDKGTVGARCITETYLHDCRETCDGNCSLSESPRAKLWICFTCHRKLLSNKMPDNAVVNNLNLKPVPNDLQCLNDLEQHLISLNIPFMKMMALPKGGQHGVHGPVVCVPSDIQKSTSILPRSDTDDQMIRVKLKRKLTYKGHYQYKFVNKSHIQNALKYLKENNKWYHDVHFNHEWINPLPVIDEKDEREMTDTDTSTDSEDNSKAEAKDSVESEIEKQHGLLLDTCLQPADIGQEVLDQHFDRVACVAPAEKNNPIKILMDESNEAKSFPVLFPSGAPTFHSDRETKITLSRYLHTRLMSADSRFARNTDYIFYAQYLYELSQILSSVSIAMRKGLPQANDRKITSQDLIDAVSLKEILKCDDGYKFLKPIRGTPPFWQCAQKDLFAMLRQLGIPTWFCSFSSADLRWTEIVDAILREENDSRKASELNWSEKCSVLRQNPVTAARMFDHRFHCFLRDVIMSPAEPIGKIKDYFYRVEFQQRGSPHTHCLFWIENAPNIDKNSDEDVKAFIDKYISCEMPSSENDEELHNIVNTVQKHSKKHSKSCRKKGTTCRFNFPRPPSHETFISRPGGGDSNDSEKKKTETMEEALASLNSLKIMTKSQADIILKRIWDILGNDDLTFQSAEALFTSIGITQDIFEMACNTLSSKTNIVLKRRPSDVWINQYSPNLLRCWDANMDIQYVVDAYSCVVYIISYISKAEREMGLLLSRTQKEARTEGNVDAKYALKKLGAVYLHHREVSAQEAVFRVCNLRMKEGSRKVQFIPTVNHIRMSLPLTLLKAKQQSGDLDEDELWMTSIVDRYKNRPMGKEFADLCLASFCSEYRIISKSEVSRTSNEHRRTPVFELENGLGYIKKRSRTEAAVIRYARFSPTRDPEKYYQSILQLFLPHRTDIHLKPPNFASFQEFYETGAVQIESQLETVRDIVKRNKDSFEKDADEIDRAEELLETSDPLEDAWAQICPETEAERLECQQEKHEIADDDPESGFEKNFPDLLTKEDEICKTEILQNIISKKEAIEIFRSLNEEQADIFYKIREWCLDKRNGKCPKPLNVFITGGAGTGKSHLIKALCYEGTKILAGTQQNPDDLSILLVAPTGVAAFNISASTIHSAFSIGINSKLPYMPLGEEKINTLRAKLQSLHIVIIDEVSMVDHKLLTYIHGRLRQIKQTVDHSPFGNVSVIAFGDFHQLPPTKAKPLCIEEFEYDLWNDNFSVAVLTKVMRQKDVEFAHLLNRLRIRTKSEPLDINDINMLKHRETGEDDTDALHIYATNAQVDDYNITTLHTVCPDPISIESKDFSRSSKSGQMEKKDSHHHNVYNTVLKKTINVAVNARVMLIKNIDTLDGLVNGVFGTISNITLNNDESFPSKIDVTFDNEKVGKKLRIEKHSACKLTPIEPQEERITNSGGIRRQYPLKLAWACTIHKVQGLTVKKAVVSLEKIFAPGQAYVALSRVTSLDGLIIEKFKDSAIYCNAKVKGAISNMPQFIRKTEHELDHCQCTIIMQNIEGLKSHIKDLQNDKRFSEADFICLTETWLTASQPKPKLDGFTFYHKPRSLSYQSQDKMLKELKTQAHGGVAVYSSNVKSSDLLHLSVSDLEYLAFTIHEIQTSVVVIYRPKSYTADVFRKNLLILVHELDRQSGAVIIMGDFNENVFTSSSVQTLMESHSLQQIVSDATAINGTLIDHVYVRGLQNLSTEVLPTYFGYHEAVRIKINTDDKSNATEIQY